MERAEEDLPIPHPQKVDNAGHNVWRGKKTISGTYWYGASLQFAATATNLIAVSRMKIDKTDITPPLLRSRLLRAMGPGGMVNPGMGTTQMAVG